MLEQIDALITKVTYRNTFHQDEAKELLEPLGVDLEHHRQYIGKQEFVDKLLDLRLEHMETITEEVTVDDDREILPEELDALLGSDISIG